MCLPLSWWHNITACFIFDSVSQNSFQELGACNLYWWLPWGWDSWGLHRLESLGWQNNRIGWNIFNIQIFFRFSYIFSSIFLNTLKACIIWSKTMFLRSKLIPLCFRRDRTADQITHAVTLQESRLNWLVLLRNWFLNWFVFVIWS